MIVIVVAREWLQDKFSLRIQRKQSDPNYYSYSFQLLKDDKLLKKRA